MAIINGQIVETASDKVLKYCYAAGQGIVMRNLRCGVCAVVDVNYFSPRVVAAGLDWFTVLASLPALPAKPVENPIREPRPTHKRRGYGRRY